MKKFFKSLAVVLAITIALFGFVACSDDDDDDTPTVAFEGTYKGTMAVSYGTLYIVVTASSGNYTIKGYINSDYSGTAVLDESGSYTISGNKVTIDMGFVYTSTDGGTTFVLTSVSSAVKTEFGDVTSTVTKS